MTRTLKIHRAGLYILNEGLHALNYVSHEDYQALKKRYSDKLVHEEQEKIPNVDPQAQKENQSMTRYFKEIYAQWELHPNRQWRILQIKKAQQYANRIPYAKLVLALEKNPYLNYSTKKRG